jgi:hypothetical protein
VRRLAQLCAHPIELDSTPGRGSRFSITVPRANAPRLAGISTRTRGTPDAWASRTLEARRIVVVDDDPAVVAAMHALFLSWNALVTVGSDASSALAALHDGGRSTVDLIVADLRLAEGQSGIDRDRAAAWRRRRRHSRDRRVRRHERCRRRLKYALPA